MSRRMEEHVATAGFSSIRRNHVTTPDIVIRGGTVHDGSGGDPYVADVAVSGGTITGIGEIDTRAEREIDASGCTVAPGFIDIHSHSDFTLLADPRAVSAIHQGVTLEVIGNCGFGCFPIADPALAKNAIYGIGTQTPITWTDMSGYLENLAAAKPAVGVLALVPNGQLRISTLGIADRPASADELKRMKYALESALDEGAWGLSTGLEYPAEFGAPEEELTELCRSVARAGALYATHTRRRDEGAAAAVEEAVRTAANADVRLQVSHLLPRNGRAEGERCIEIVESARARGLDVAFDMHTRLHGITYLHTVIPPWALEGGPEALATRLGDSQARDRMKEFVSIPSAGNDWNRVVLFDNARWPEYARRSIADIAESRGQEPLDAAYDLLLGVIDRTHELKVILHCYTEDEQQSVFSHPLCMPGSDATTMAPDGPFAGEFFHGAYSWASWFYRFMVRDTKALSPAEAIRRLTGLPAQVLNLPDRGAIKRGARADIAIFAPATFGERATTYEPNQLATGMAHVLVNGVLTLYEGALTGERGGQVMRRQRGGSGG